MGTRSSNIKRKRKSRKSIWFFLRNNLTVNIGTLVFGAIFLYMLISVVLYLTTERISTYQVIAGPLAKNQTYTGFVVRNEKVIYSNTGGYITYYARNNARVKNNGVVYGIGESRENEEDSIVITDTVLNSLKSDMSMFSSGFDTNDFSDIYRFKYEIEGKLLQNNTQILQDQTTTKDSITAGNQTIYTSDANGLVLYSMDGYEDYDSSQITGITFQTKNYHLENLKTKERVNAGDPVYRIITDENWSVYIPLTDKQVIQLADKDSVRVRFLKDDVTQSANIVVHTDENGSYYGELKFTTGVIRYSSERFIEIELVTNTTVGLKIPISSIVKKNFYTIPVEYGTKGGDSDDVGFLVQKRSSRTEESPQFVQLTIYEEKDGLYYVDPNDIDSGDLILQSESMDRYTIGDTDTLEGVYCINKGYAVFRKIVIIDKNDEYCIVETQTPYGLAQFDHIVQDSAALKEQEILY